METFDTTKIITDDLIKVGYRVALNKRNSLGLPQFHTQGVGNSVPDIFFWDPLYEDEIFSREFIPVMTSHIKAGFIETKPGDHMKELIEGIMQNTRYYGYFVSEKALISVEGRRIFNVDCFLVGTKWSRTGMLYKGDDFLKPQLIPFISEAYNVLVPPCTIIFHGLARHFQKLKRVELRNMKLNIPSHMLEVQTGIMICKIPYEENLSISYEYYAYLGNKLRILDTKPDKSNEFIETKVIVHKVIGEAVLIETRVNEKFWIPKNQIHNPTSLIEKELSRIKISRLFYKRREKQFGII
ncbi:hypothetical protein LCGC14_2088050 [marine sediment metagenome]|uniref:Uncharacterized protein n=1 Tax=marine sediment metagenome TaxID=412755 RepID=A0A0F9EDT9_9ZZZZ